MTSYTRKPASRLNWLQSLLSRLTPQRDLVEGRTNGSATNAADSADHSLDSSGRSAGNAGSTEVHYGYNLDSAGHPVDSASARNSVKEPRICSSCASPMASPMTQLEDSELCLTRGAERKVGELALFPPKERWDDWKEWDPKAWPRKVPRNYILVPTVCFNCEAACGLLAYVDKDTKKIRKFEGNPEHPGSRGRNCAKGPATINQVEDPERILTPLKRRGKRGSGQWQETTWDEVLDTLGAKIRKAIQEKRNDQIMYHVGRPGEDMYTERVLAAWGVDGHNSHTNICSSSARAGYAFWMGIDRPSPDYANARFILLISAHLESGHYFNPHAQRIIEAKMRGAKIAVMDPRLSNTASHADYWVPCYPGSEPSLLLAIAYNLIRTRRLNEPFVKKWVNWQEYMEACCPGEESSFENFLTQLEKHYSKYTPEYASECTGVDAKVIVQLADEIARAGEAFATHTWRASCAGNLGGWQTARCLFFLNVLTGSVATPGGTTPNSWNKFVPQPMTVPTHPEHWNEITWPKEFPLAFFEMSFLLPHLLKEGRNTLDVYFTRVYNPVWTNPDGMTWIEVLKDESKIGIHCALTPVWSETAWFADYVLPMGLGPERHDLHSYETQAANWIGFRQPVMKAARERLGEGTVTTLDATPGQVWEENEFWIELSWRIDPDGELGIRKHFESPYRPGEKVTIDEYYAWIFENSVPGLKEKAAEENLTPLAYMRRYGCFELDTVVYKIHDQKLTESDLDGAVTDEATGRIYKDKTKLKKVNFVPLPIPVDGEGRHLIGINIDGTAVKGFPTPSGKLEFYSKTVAEWGWPELALPAEIESHVSRRFVSQGLKYGEQNDGDMSSADKSKAETSAADKRSADTSNADNPTAEANKTSTADNTTVEANTAETSTADKSTDVEGPSSSASGAGKASSTTKWNHSNRFCLVPTFRLPVLIHTRSSNAKWLTEIAHSNPLWINTIDAERLGIRTGDLVKVETEIGYYVTRAWVTESIAPTVVACSHHMGRWRLDASRGTDRWCSALTDLSDEGDGKFLMRQKEGVRPFESTDPDSMRVWWNDAGVHQNITFPVQPDPISGMHCWHQNVTVSLAGPKDRYADVFVDTKKSHEVYKRWMSTTRPAPGPDGMRRPWWMLRPLRPTPKAYKMD